jgi:hypothetical protein
VVASFPTLSSFAQQLKYKTEKKSSLEGFQNKNEIFYKETQRS